MKILVTGGAGFLGLHVTSLLLARGIHVRILDNFSISNPGNIPREADVIEGDVRDATLVGRALVGVDGVIHLAAVSSLEAVKRNVVESNAINVGGTVNVFEAACKQRGAPVPVVYASSAAVYGTNGTMPLSEDCTPAPISKYGVDKLDNERSAKAAFERFGLSSVGLRIFNAFGPTLDGSNGHTGVISNFCSAIESGQAVTIYGDGRQTRDFVHAEDVARAILLSLRREQGAEIFNVCTGVETTVVQLATKIASHCKKALHAGYQPSRDGEIVRSLGCPKLASAKLGFEAAIDLDEGLSRLLANPASLLGKTNANS